MKHGGPLKRRTRLRQRGKRGERLKAEQFGPQAALCRASTCLVMGCRKRAEPHHVVSRGRGGLDDVCVPLCREHHREGHAHGWTNFELTYGVDLWAEVEWMRGRVRNET